jgi:uncharacterized peroxidase-related enzyme
MTRFSLPEPAAVHPDARPVLDAAKAALGFTPNLHRLIALNPQVLSAWVALQGALSHTLDLKTRDAIALAVTEVNDCDYCRVAHAYGASTFSKLSPEEIQLNREGRSADAKRGAAAQFAKRVTERRGKIDDEDLEAVRAAGWSDPEIVAIVAVGSQFLFTNFLNNVAETPADFPRASGPTGTA